MIVLPRWVVSLVTRFQPSNVRDEPQINSYRVNGGEYDNGDKFIESQTGIECEINVDRRGIIIHDFWDGSTDYIIDIGICDVNQASNQTSNENEKKKKYLKFYLEQRRHLTYRFCRIL